MRPDDKTSVPVAGIIDRKENSGLSGSARNSGGMTDPTYETESHHTPESLDRDARFVGHEVETDTIREEIAAERAEVMKLRKENERLRAQVEALTPSTPPRDGVE